MESGRFGVAAVPVGLYENVYFSDDEDGVGWIADEGSVPVDPT